MEKDTRIGTWTNVAKVEPNNFKFKALSSWSFNIGVGCVHACRFCYVPSVSTIKQGDRLAQFGVKDPDAEWGEYFLLRRWDENAFRASVRRAEQTPIAKLNADGNRAVMFCTTTDPYQTTKDPEINSGIQRMVRRALEIILEESTLNVRILTRSPLARRDFDLMARFGPRLMFGMSLPTMSNYMARVYEPNAPAPSKRLETLLRAKQMGLNIYVAVAPTYPFETYDLLRGDIAKLLAAITPLEPMTIFMEPINIRAENVQRIETHARAIGVPVFTEVFKDRKAWVEYAWTSLLIMHGEAVACGMDRHLHLWPDASLAAHVPKLDLIGAPNPRMSFLQKWWNRRSEWPQTISSPPEAAERAE